MSSCDLRFKNITFKVTNSITKKNKIILDNVSGEFRSGELTAIIGCSGSGKSSLLNILSGYQTTNVNGCIELNGLECQNYIRQYSSYIMQEYKFHAFITVQETLMFTINCKATASDNRTQQEKISNILDKIGMSKQRDVYVGDLSGGEQKRLSIAVELLDNPKILFLDEPTTHLDSVSTTQCIKFLKDLALEGRTVVCTIHQPSVKVFQSFDHIYALAKGFCIYQGTCCEIVTFLKDLDLICPPSHTPADFLLEVSNNDYGNQNDWLREKIALRESREKKSLDIEPDMRTAKKLMKILSAQSMGYEILALTKRNWRNSLRDKTLTLLRLAIHFLISAFIGVMYQGIGQEGSNILNTYKFLFFNIFVLMFTAFSSLQTTFPLEFPIIKRENFNGTYTILSYFIALAISDAPILIICNLIYVSIAYILTDQPIELFRFFAYFLTVLLLSFASQGLGLIAGSMLNLKFTLILGSFFMCPFVLFSNFFIQMKDSEKIFHVLFNLSFIKHAFDGSMISIFGFNREKMNCDADYCHFRQPNKFLEFLEIDESFLSIMLKLLGFTVVFRVIAFLVMYVRLKR